jgi:flagellar biosynthesis chaperone FliJ
MAVSRALRRLLRVLTIEEDQCKMALESATGGLRQLQRARDASLKQARSGRQLVVSSARSGELPDRLAGLEETHSAHRRSQALAPRIADAESEVETRRQEFLLKRVECRQAETLIREAEARDAIVAARRSQQGLDDWYLNRLQGVKNSAKSLLPTRLEPQDSPIDPSAAEDLNRNTPETLPPS